MAEPFTEGLSHERPAKRPFTPKPMVHWMDPHLILAAAGRAGVAAMFGAYADRREMISLLEPNEREHKSRLQTAPMWFDFVADTGDGFGSTYSVAHTLARPELNLAFDGTEHATQRGALLVLGGDQVYPTPSRHAYEHKFRGPFEAALPWSDEAEAPELFAIPGNHDWYDGLTGFIRLFCSDDWVGGWRTRQKRSYWALRLPANWWIWGLDIQLGSLIDAPQINYFKAMAALTGPTDRIILCTGRPAWAMQKRAPEAWQNLEYFWNKVVAVGCQGRVALTVSGDLHHYVHYVPKKGSGNPERITCGGGGAYMSPTFNTPDPLDVCQRDGSTQRYERAGTFPSPCWSRAQLFRIWLLPLRNRWFALLVAFLYTSGPLALQADSFRTRHPFFVDLECSSWLDAWKVFGAHTPESAWGVVAFTFLTVALVAYTIAGETDVKMGRATGRKVLLGLLHALLHLALMVNVTWWAVHGFSGSTRWFVLVPALVVAGAAGGTMLMALYLALCALGGLHANEAFVAQGSPHYKSFLRFHIDEQGQLTVYPVGLRKTLSRRHWRYLGDGPDQGPRFEPTPGHRLEPELIEAPFTIP